MSRQLDQHQEERQAKRKSTLSKALEYGIAGSFESQGNELRGIAIRYDVSSCLLTVKAIVDGAWCVAFIGSDTMENCILKLDLEARHHRLRWKPDQYHQE